MSNVDVHALESVSVGVADREILELEAALRAAQLGADVEALDRLISEELLFTGPDGRLATKAEDLEAYRSGAIRMREHAPEELRISRISADVAVVALRTRLTVEVSGQLVSGVYRYTRIWGRKQGGPFRIVGGHVAAAAGEGSPIAATRALHAALESGAHGDQLRPLFTEDAYTIEHPNLIKPKGAKTSLEQMLAASSAGAGLLATQRYDVHSALEQGDTAIVRLTWTGTIARTLGALREGQVLTAHIAQFVTVRKGRIASIETFDCYEPFST